MERKSNSIRANRTRAKLAIGNCMENMRWHSHRKVLHSHGPFRWVINNKWRFIWHFEFKNRRKWPMTMSIIQNNKLFAKSWNRTNEKLMKFFPKQILCSTHAHMPNCRTQTPFLSKNVRDKPSTTFNRLTDILSHISWIERMKKKEKKTKNKKKKKKENNVRKSLSCLSNINTAIVMKRKRTW